MKDYRTCVVCRKQYSFCPHCGKDKNKPLWLFTFCSEKCKGIYEVMSSYESGEFSAKESKNALEKLHCDEKLLVDSYRNTFEKIKATISKENAEKEGKNESAQNADSKNNKVFKVSKKEPLNVEQ